MKENHKSEVEGGVIKGAFNGSVGDVSNEANGKDGNSSIKNGEDSMKENGDKENNKESLLRVEQTPKSSKEMAAKPTIVLEMATGAEPDMVTVEEEHREDVLSSGVTENTTERSENAPERASESASDNTSFPARRSSVSLPSSDLDPSTLNTPRQVRQSRRSPSVALSISSTSSGHQTISSVIFVKKALETINRSKDARKISALDTSVSRALKQFDKDPNTLPVPTTVFEPLRIVCSKSNNVELKAIALDCIAKLFTFSYLEDPESPKVAPKSGITSPPVVPLIDRAVQTVCDTYNKESTDPRIELQIIKALMAAVLNEDLIVHGNTLLSAIRQTYYIFIYSHSHSNQGIAQATLTQMVNVVFDRVKNAMLGLKSRDSSRVASLSNADVTTKSWKEGGSEFTPSSHTGSVENLTLQKMESRRSVDESRVIDNTSDFNESDLLVRDAFLVFRTLCKLSEKPLEGDGSDTKSHGVRSKLLSLHLIHTILKTHISVFLSNDIKIKLNSRGEERFVISIKDYVCSTLARNAASISPAVFEISAEIFWLLVSNLRSQFKKEIQVFLSEIYFPVAEMKTSTAHQKQYFLSVLERLCNDPRALVEIYLNYDCDRSSPINVYEHIIDLLVRMALTPVHMTQLQLQNYHENKQKPVAVYNLSLPPALSIANVTSDSHHPEAPSYPPEYALKMSALESLVAILRSLLSWSQRGIAAVSASLQDSAAGKDNAALAVVATAAGETTATIIANASKSGRSTSDSSRAESPGSVTPVDDPTQFESLKHRKAALNDAIRDFNYKPKRGIENLINGGFIKSREPEDIARFLLTTEGLDKATIGDYLGGDASLNVSIMHAFVDLMDFTNMSFVDALRRFLQAFRLPGESQKIDRYMLKFAERYISGNPSVFSNADTPYILAYSVIMLNTDLHSREVKKRMSAEDFIKNNRGINDRSDLPEEFLLNIYNEIQQNEIKLLSEQHAALISSGGETNNRFGSNLGLALATVGRDLQREAYIQASREMSNKTEQLFKSLISRDGKRKNGVDTETFYFASHIEHVKPMFEVCWMSLLAGLSGPFQENDDPDTVRSCLEGIRLCIRIACLFDIELPRISFVSALAKFTNLQNLSEVKWKNVEATKVLLSTTLSEANMLKSSWKDILTCISQLERFQLIGSGIAPVNIPDVTNARLATRASIDARNQGNYASSQRDFSPEIAEEMRSTELVVDMDKIFTQSSQLSGEAIVDFVKALTEVSWEEIQSSGQSAHPRIFSLQKMVDVCYYNMERIRVEWSQLWAIMGSQYNQVGCHSNVNVVHFALDSLRQLSMRFFDLEELPHFKFQKDFLAPFEYVMKNNPDVQAKDLVLRCLNQMIQAKSVNIKSGWSAMFGVFAAAAKVPHAPIVKSAFEMTKKVHSDYLNEVIAQDSFGDLVMCLSEIAKNPRFQKTSLHAVELLMSTISQVGEMNIKGDQFDKAWFPILSGFHEIIMNGEDLEVRSRALNYLFDILVEHGGEFEPAFWDSICRKLLFPIFIVLKSRSSLSQDEMSVWLSTTMIQALRNMISLLTHYFKTLERMLEGFLELLVTCIDQENDTVSRIGSSCLLQLIVHNADTLQPYHWKLIVYKIEGIFKSTTAQELFGTSLLEDKSVERSPASTPIEDPSVGIDQEYESSNGHVPSSGQRHSVHRQRPKEFQRTIEKSILQLLMIEMTDELFANENVFNKMPLDEILRLSKCLRSSYLFARKFNEDRELRIQLWRRGFMKQMPNLLRQESAAAATYITIMMKLYSDHSKLDGGERRDDVGAELIPLTVDILGGYNQLEPNEQRYINTLLPVVIRILNEYVNFNQEEFVYNIHDFYPAIVGILRKEMNAELRDTVYKVLDRVGKVSFKGKSKGYA